MITSQIHYTDKETLQAFIADEHIFDSPSLLIQVFTAYANEDYISNLLTVLGRFLPQAAVIGSTTDGEIIQGEVTSQKTVLSFTQFEHTTLRVCAVEDENDSYASGQTMAKKLIQEDTKLLISFADGLHTNAEAFLKGVDAVSEDVTIAGGLAGDNSAFVKTLVFTKEQILSKGAVGVALNSPKLLIHTDHSFNWHPIGNDLSITKSEGRRLYAIDGRSAVDTYAHYLGEDIAQQLPYVGAEFPLIVKRDGVNIARAVISKEEDGSLILGGNLYAGEKVRIGYGDRKEILKKSKKIFSSVSQKPSEAIFVYSCMARRHFMGDDIASETLPLQHIAPVCGFFTYGEFFTSGQKELLNKTMTLVSLSEHDNIPSAASVPYTIHAGEDPTSIQGLTHLINVTSREVETQTQILQSTGKLNQELKERMELALLGNSAGVWEWNLQNDSVYCSAEWKKMLGYKDHELPNILSIWSDRIHPEDKAVVMSELEAVLASETTYIESTHRLKHRNGDWIWILGRATIEYGQNAKPLRMIGIHTDITQQKALQNKSSERGRILDNSLNEIYIFDAKNMKFLYVNKRAERNLGYTLEEIACLTPLDIKPNISSEAFSHYLKVLTEEQKDHVHFSTLHQRKDRSTYYVDVYMQSTVFESSQAYVAIILDVSKRRSSEVQLQKQKNILYHQAHHDALTGLPNRVLFTKRLQNSIELAKEHATRLALFFIDIDKFKDINDSLGHGAGDTVLTNVAKRLSESLRAEDTLARLSGDEFTVTMDHVKHIDDVSMLAEKLLSVLAEPMYIDKHILYVSASIGVSLYPQDAAKAEDLLKYADTAMYKAKEKGRNTFEFYTAEMTQLALEHLEMKTRLRQGIDNREFVIHYQPQINAASDALVGVEALLRWEHPEKGLIGPDAFLPLAEETGMIMELDRWVLSTAIKQVTQWYKEGLNPGVLAVNLSIKQLENDDFLKELVDHLSNYDFKPEWLELEITEGHMMKQPEDTIAKLNQIDALGIGISIDDFGTGYSSLSFLKQLPINRLKIDQSFTRDITHDEDDRVIIKAIIALGKSLKLDLIAEGVETSEQRDFLIENGCSNMQGYYYSNPVPAEEMQPTLAAYAATV